MLTVVQLPVLTDNYIYLLHDEATGTTGVVDPAEATPVLDELARRGWQLGWILNTHHHGDHVGGNAALVAATGCRVVGPRADQARIPLIQTPVGDGDVFRLGASPARVFDTPGHTRGHIVYWFEQDAALFAGDTLFALGCGRLFEGSPEQMWESLAKLAALPPETRVYCAHEYTESNLRFALAVAPDDPALLARGQRVRALRAASLPTVPSALGEELATNPFLRAGSAARFAELRRAKDSFR
jgi:hydroxyacylglutathione hydrolase